MSRVCALVDGNGLVVNRILLEIGTEYDPGPGLQVVADESDVSQIGGRWNGQAFEAVPQPAPLASTLISGAAFVARLSDDELLDLLSAAMVDAKLARFVLLLRGSIDSASEVATAAKASLIDSKRLTPQRADAIFAGS